MIEHLIVCHFAVFPLLLVLYMIYIERDRIEQNKHLKTTKVENKKQNKHLSWTSQPPHCLTPFYATSIIEVSSILHKQ